MKYRCIATLSLWLTVGLLGEAAFAQTEPLTITAFGEPLRCFGDVDGELSGEILGGTPPYTYEWSRQNNAFVFASGTQEMPGATGPVTGALEANTYLLFVTDATGLTMTTTVELIAPDPILVTAIEVTASSCADACDGSIFMEVAGGTGALTISWADDPTISTPSRDLLCADEYLFFLIDEAGCDQKGIVPIDGPAPLTLAIESIATSCPESSDGALSVAAAGGMGVYNYAWSSGSSEAALTNAAADTYTLTVTDANNCSADTVLTISAGPALIANSQIGYGCGDGRILVRPQPINGVAPYSYQWSTGQDGPYLYGASAGDYALTLTDARGCVAVENLEVDFVAPLVLESVATNVSCFGAENGSAELEISGGSPPFQIEWDSGQNDATINDLAGGTYTYNLSADGCGEAGTVQIFEPSEIETNIAYELQLDGLLTASTLPFGGTPPYEFSWSTGSSTQEVYDLNPSQTYHLTVTDATGCFREWELQPGLTATETINLEKVTVFPNPTSGICQINFVDDHAAQYRILDASGREHFTWQPLSDSKIIDLTDRPSGIYLLQIERDGQLQSARIVKN